MVWMPVTRVHNLGWAVPSAAVAAQAPPWAHEAPPPADPAASAAVLAAAATAAGHVSPNDPYDPDLEPRRLPPPRLDTRMPARAPPSTPSPASDSSAARSDEPTSSDTDEDLIHEGPPSAVSATATADLGVEEDDDDPDDVMTDCDVKEEPESGTPTPVTPGPGGLHSLPATPLTATAPRRPSAAIGSGVHGPAPKRPRGRPRSSTLPKERPAPKTTQTRTKTGCLTCRRRKKKCDERKPECDNCNKNNIVCEGYPSKQFYMSGRQARPVPDTRLLKIDRMPEQPRHVFPGLETDLDYFLFEHFHSAMSTILTLDDATSNPFVELVMPMSLDHKGLMHSLLALSGSHMSRYAPDNRAYEERRSEHFGRAMSALCDEVAEARTRGPGAEPAESLIASIIIQCLIPITEGSVDGNHRTHLAAARACIKQRPGSPFGEFAWEFFKYHDMSNTMTSLERPPLSPEELAADDADDALAYPWAPTTDPATGLPAASAAVAALPPASAGGGDEGAPPGLTGLPPQPQLHMPATAAPPGGEGVMIGVCDGLFRYITRITAIRDRIRERKRRGVAPVVEYRSIRAASALGARLRAWRSGHAARTPKWVAAELYRETAFVYLHRSLRASRPDPDLALRVGRGLAYLRAMPADHAAQSIALLPTFVLGCAAFDAAQRAAVAAAFRQLSAYSRLGNIDRAHEVVARVWDMMDRGDERSWDWETVMAEMGYNFLVT